MLISQLELERFKSYERAVISFAPGTNAILGVNGAGKSSLLEAIGFALFDHKPPGCKLASLVREGARSAHIVVTLVSGVDERVYEIERRFTTSTTTFYRVLDAGLSRDPSERVCLAEGGEAVKAWLRAQLDLDPATALDELFQNTIGVPQGTITAPFLQSAGVRKAFFDPLLQVEEYRKASDALLPTQRELEERHAALSRDIAALDGRLENLADLTEEQAQLEQTIKDLGQSIEALRQEHEQALAQVEILEAASERARQTATRLETARHEMSTAEQQLAGSQSLLAEAVTARETADASRAGYDAYLEASKRREELDAVRIERDRLLGIKAECERELAQLGAQVSHLQEQLQYIREAEQKTEQLAPLARRQDDLEAQLRQKREQALALAQLEDHLAQEQRDATEAKLEMKRIEAEIEQGEMLDVEIAELRKRLQAVAEKQQRQSAELATSHSEATRLTKQWDTLEQSETAKCPTCEAELSPDRRRELVARNRDRLTELAASVTTLEAALVDQSQETRRLQNAADAKQAALRELATADGLERARATQQKIAAHITRLEAQIDQLRSAPEETAFLEQALQQLGDPGQKMAALRVQIEQRPALEDRLAQAVSSESQARGLLADLDSHLRPYATIEQELQAANHKAQHYLTSHQSYLRAIELAERLEERRKRVKDLATSLGKLRGLLTERQQEHQVALAGYDQAEHQRVRSESNELAQRLAEQRTRRSMNQTRREQVQNQIATLETLQIERAKKQERSSQTSKLVDVVETVRRILRQAGPLVTRELVRQISRQASAFYAEIIGDHTGQLRWSEDYEILLTVKGRERTFQQLSGGERMTAALAVRLALMRRVSSLDIAIFDEPTAHLDPERRESLVEQIMRVRGFRQLFVISHDDSFERAAQNVVHIVKDEHGSRVEGARPC